MSNLQYVGARYVPKLFTNPDDGTNSWKSGIGYEALTIVTDNDDSYTSKKTVPGTIGRPADNPDYWVLTGNFNAALTMLQNRMTAAENDISDIKPHVTDIVVVTPDMTQAEIADVIANNHSVYFAAGTYDIQFTTNGEAAFEPISNQKIILSPAAILKVVPNAFSNYYVFKIKNVSNVEILGGQIVGDKDTHTGITGEWGDAIAIVGPSANIHIHDMELSYMWGDGIETGPGANISENVVNLTFENLYIHHTRRNGISICEANGLTIKNVLIEDLLGGTYPMAGIDFEPYWDGINIIDCNVSDVIVKNCYRGTMVAHVKNGKIGINFDKVFVYNATGRMIEVTGNNSTTGGIVRFSNYYGEDISTPIKIFDHDDNSFRIEIENVYCHGVEVDTSDPNYHTAQDSIIAIFSGGSFSGDAVGNISIKNVYADDNNNTYYGFITSSAANDIKIEAPTYIDASANLGQKTLICQCTGSNCNFNSQYDDYIVRGNHPETFENALSNRVAISGDHSFTSTDYELMGSILIRSNKQTKIPVNTDALITYNSGSPSGLKIVEYIPSTMSENTLVENTSGGTMTATGVFLLYPMTEVRVYGKNVLASGASGFALTIDY